MVTGITEAKTVDELVIARLAKAEQIIKELCSGWNARLAELGYIARVELWFCRGANDRTALFLAEAGVLTQPNELYLATTLEEIVLQTDKWLAGLEPRA